MCLDTFLDLNYLPSLDLIAKKLVMGGAAGFFLELMLFIGFKYNMTTRLGHFILLTQHKLRVER